MATGGTAESRGRRPTKFACGTPAAACNGHNCSDLGKFHDTDGGAKGCQRRYLLKVGFTATDQSRTFAAPNDGPYFVVSKKAQRLKPGKTSDRYMSQPLKVRDSLPVR